MISAIVAMSDNFVIGVNNQLPWHIPEDLAHFKKITNGHPIIMGRKTFESIGKILPNRTNIIITKQAGYDQKGAVIAGGLDEAVKNASASPGGEEIFIIGGGEIFKMAMPIIQKLYLTIVHKNIDGDVFFPEIPKEFKEISSDNSKPEFSFVNLQRI